MSIAEGVCDYCGRGHLLETGDEGSQIQLGKLWCGTCRAGSKERYANYESKRIQGQIDIMREMLEWHPLQWDKPGYPDVKPDHFRMHMFKLDYNDEAYRMERELEFRESDNE